jgi:glycosyltransferase involved in cell wall biosynthesis
MTVWLVNPYGPLPSEAWRTYCFPLIAEALVEAGHEVIWWTSNFAHHFKKFRSDGWRDVKVSDRFTIRLVPTPGYRRNIGLGRVLRDIVFAYRCYKRGRAEPRPDLVIYAESPLTFGFAGQRLADYHRCASIYHQMDLWPELIVRRAPRMFQSLVDLAFEPVYAIRRKTYSRLSAATALASPYLEAVIKDAPCLADRPQAVIYNGIDVHDFRAKMRASTQWPPGFPEKCEGDIWAIFAGSLGPSYDIGTMCTAAEILAAEDSNIRILIAGDGPERARVEAAARGVSARKNLFYLGQLSPSELAAVYSRCDIGLCAYSSSSNVEMPDKIYDYTAAQLPVLVSLTGEVSRMVATHGAGLPYRAGSAEDLCAQMGALASDSLVLAEMARASGALGLEFDKKKQYSKFVQIVQSVTGSPRAMGLTRHDSAS